VSSRGAVRRHGRRLWYFGPAAKNTDITPIHDTLIFGQAYQGGASLDPRAAAAALPDDAEICGCNGVCKGTITQAITVQRLDHAGRGSRADESIVLLRTMQRRGRDAAEHGARR